MVPTTSASQNRVQIPKTTVLKILRKVSILFQNLKDVFDKCQQDLSNGQFRWWNLRRARYLWFFKTSCDQPVILLLWYWYYYESSIDSKNFDSWIWCLMDWFEFSPDTTYNEHPWIWRNRTQKLIGYVHFETSILRDEIFLKKMFNGKASCADTLVPCGTWYQASLFSCKYKNNENS